MADDPYDATDALALLRSDLPSEQAKTRMRARLLATSAFAGAAAAQAGSKAMASSAPPSSLANGSLNLLGTKLAALPMAIKVAAIVAATAGASVSIGNIASTPTPTPHIAAAPLTASKVIAPSHAGEEARARAAELPPDLAVQLPIFAESLASKAEKTHEAIGIRSRRAQRAPERVPKPLSQESLVHDLQQESELLLSALRAIEAKAPLRAQALLTEHERRFGSTSRLTLERNRLHERLHQGAQNPPVQQISEGTSP